MLHIKSSRHRQYREILTAQINSMLITDYVYLYLLFKPHINKSSRLAIALNLIL